MTDPNTPVNEGELSEEQLQSVSGGLSEQFQDARDATMNKLNEKFQDARDTTMNKLNETFDKSHQDNLNT